MTLILAPYWPYSCLRVGAISCSAHPTPKDWATWATGNNGNGTKKQPRLAGACSHRCTRERTLLESQASAKLYSLPFQAQLHVAPLKTPPTAPGYRRGKPVHGAITGNLHWLMALPGLHPRSNYPSQTL